MPTCQVAHSMNGQIVKSQFAEELITQMTDSQNLQDVSSSHNVL